MQRLLCAIYGTEEECDEFLLNASPEEIETILVDAGVDLVELQKKLDTMMARIRAMHG